MFTGNTTDLASAVRGLEAHCQRDVSFSYIGKVPTDLPRRVVPVSKPGHLEAALALDGIAGVIAPPGLAAQVPARLGLVVSETPVATSLHVHERLCAMEGFLWAHFDTRIDSTARVHPSAVIAERDVQIGPGAVVGPTSVVLERSVIEGGATVGVGVVVGLDAFEIFEEANPRRILRQGGGVWIEPGATILAKSTLVRATFAGFTRIRRSAMLDVLIHVAHDVDIGENATVVACAEISGRCVLGEGAYIGPNATLRNGLTIGVGSTVSMGAVVTRDVPDDTTVSGNFAVPHAQWLAFVKNLPKPDSDGGATP